MRTEKLTISLLSTVDTLRRSGDFGNAYDIAYSLWHHSTPKERITLADRRADIFARWAYNDLYVFGQLDRLTQDSIIAEWMKSR